MHTKHFWQQSFCKPRFQTNSETSSELKRAIRVKPKTLAACSGLTLMLALLSTSATAQQRLPECEKEGQVITLNLNTGSGANGSKDIHWTVAGGGTAPDAYSTTPVSSWAVPAAAKWIQPATGGSPSSNFPQNTTYTYKTTFSVTPVMFLLGGITLQGKFSADNAAKLKLNGKPVTGVPCNGNPTICFRTYTPIPASASAYIQAGINTLEVEVRNNETYTGLIVEASVVSKCERCKH